MELSLLLGFSMWGGEKLSKKIEGFESNLLPQEIVLIVQEEERQEHLKRSLQNIVLSIRAPVQNIKKNLMSPQQFHLNKNADKNRNINILCRKCAGGHPTID